jgi:hypothetical protein
MPGEFKQLRNDLLIFPVESDDALAQSLIESVDAVVDENDEGLWLEEIGRRDAQLRDGTATPKPVDQVMQEARAIFGWKSFRERRR